MSLVMIRKESLENCCCKSESKRGEDLIAPMDDNGILRNAYFEVDLGADALSNESINAFSNRSADIVQAPTQTAKKTTQNLLVHTILVGLITSLSCEYTSSSGKKDKMTGPKSGPKCSMTMARLIGMTMIP